jgi:hypothetical protein
MVGSVIIYEPDPERFDDLDEMDDLDDFTTVSLGSLTTLDFQEMVDKLGAEWAGEDPLLFDEEEGFALFEVRPAGLRLVLDAEHELTDERAEDLQRLREFIAKNGYEHIYELATF